MEKGRAQVAFVEQNVDQKRQYRRPAIQRLLVRELQLEPGVPQDSQRAALGLPRRQVL